MEGTLTAKYPIVNSCEGADAYAPLMLLKGLLRQKWYRIDFDPKLENQINDRISFKKFMGLSFDQHSPDHSTISRFRGRLSKEAMNKINRVILQRFSRKGLTINEGVTVDACLVQSDRPSDQQREKREGKLDKNGKPLKFSRDLDSDWVLKNNKPNYGLKEHAAVDTNNGFVLATEWTPASVNDSAYLPYCVAVSGHTEDPIEKVYADKGYYGEPNSGFLHLNGIEDGTMRKNTKST